MQLQSMWKSVQKTAKVKLIWIHNNNTLDTNPYAHINIKYDTKYQQNMGI